MQGHVIYGMELIRLLILFLGVWMELLQTVNGRLAASITCVQVGAHQEEANIWDKQGGVFSIGAEDFKIKYANAFDAGVSGDDGSMKFFTSETYNHLDCPTLWADQGPSYTHDIEFCTSQPDLMDIKLYLVKQGERMLHGWLHIEVEMNDFRGDEIEAIYFQMRDEHFNAIGEFVTKPGQTCQPIKSHEDYPSPSPYQVLPCSAIGVREPKPCQGVFMMKKSQLLPDCKAAKNTDEYLGGDPSKGISLTWKFSEYWCNRHKFIRADAFVLTKSNIEFFEDLKREGKFPLNADDMYTSFTHMLQRVTSDWVTTDWFGAADIVTRKGGPLKCDIPVKNVTTRNLTDAARKWLLKLTSVGMDNDYTNVKFFSDDGSGRKSLGSCQVDPYPTATRKKEDILAFGGRCTDHVKKDPSPGAHHGCKQNDEVFADLNQTKINFTEYEDYRQNLAKDRNATCAGVVKCYMPITPEEKKKLLSYPKNAPKVTTEVQIRRHNITRSKRSVAKFWFGRKYHGMLCIIASLGFIPISIFNARYLKETFMHYKIYGVNAWYCFHAALNLAAFILFFSSLTALAPGIRSWGQNEDTAGVIHRQMGYTTLVLFTLLLFLGGLRVGVRLEQRKVRLASMVLHSFLGFLTYFMNLGILITSSFIPGSPSVGKCNINRVPSGAGPLVFIVIAWIPVDISFHICLTLMQIWSDKKAAIRRGWYFPILPILPASADHETKDGIRRKIMFIMYCVVCSLFCIGAISTVGVNEMPKNCGYGTMSCNVTQWPLGCDEIAKKFFSWKTKSTS